LGAEGEIIVPGAKERALLAYLVVSHPKVHQREALRELLWASRFEAQGRQSLRQALYRLRKLLGSEVFISSGAVQRPRSGVPSLRRRPSRRLR
jgi:DNA-binding SARP family transcriptional activator